MGRLRELIFWGTILSVRAPGPSLGLENKVAAVATTLFFIDSLAQGKQRARLRPHPFSYLLPRHNLCVRPTEPKVSFS